jgi:hypothetical protein
MSNTAAARRQILKSLRLINRVMRSAVDDWNPNQTGYHDPEAGAWVWGKMPPRLLPEHRTDQLDRLYESMEDVIAVASSVRDAADDMRKAIADGRDPDAQT